MSYDYSFEDSDESIIEVDKYKNELTISIKNKSEDCYSSIDIDYDELVVLANFLNNCLFERIK